MKGFAESTINISCLLGIEFSLKKSSNCRVSINGDNSSQINLEVKNYPRILNQPQAMINKSEITIPRMHLQNLYIPVFFFYCKEPP